MILTQLKKLKLFETSFVLAFESKDLNLITRKTFKNFSTSIIEHTVEFCTYNLDFKSYKTQFYINFLTGISVNIVHRLKYNVPHRGAWVAEGPNSIDHGPHVPSPPSRDLHDELNLLTDNSRTIC